MKQYAALDAQLASRSSHQSLELTRLDAIRKVTPETVGDRSKEPLLLQNAIRLIAAMNGRIPTAALVKELVVSGHKVDKIFANGVAQRRQATCEIFC